MNSKFYFPLILLISIITGIITGYLLGPAAIILKPLGDIFLNLLFAAVVPLIFFSVASSVSHIGNTEKIFKLFFSTIGVFIFTGIIAAIYMLCIVQIFPVASNVTHAFLASSNLTSMNIGEKMVSIITVPDFIQLLSYKNMMPLIIFSLLTGLSCAAIGENGKSFSQFLHSGAEVFLKFISYIMYFAPIGFFAWFAILANKIGPELVTNYFRIFLLYYSSAIIYFIFAFSFYAWLGGGIEKIKLFWKNVFLPMMIAFATCSSAASIPVNLLATRNMKVSEDVCETVIPIGAILHKDGTVIGAIIKIAFLFAIFGMNFGGPVVFATAVFIALMGSIVMGAIPGGGMLAEMLILSMYGLPAEALPMIAAISLMIDPLATMLNVTGDSVAAMIIDRIMSGKSKNK